MDFYTHRFLISVFECVANEKQGWVGHYQPLLTCSPIHLLTARGLIIMLISRLPISSATIDSCTLIYKSLIEKGAADIFASVHTKDMTVCWWYYPYSHSCISRLSGRQCGGCQWWLLKAVFLFTHQNIENISSNELSLPPKNKDPGCHSVQCVLHSCLPTVWWADVWMIMLSHGLASLRRAAELLLCHTHHFHSFWS